MTSEQRLRGFIGKFAPATQKLIRGARAALRRLAPTANELVYDNYNFLVIAYCPSEKTSESYFSLGADKNGVNLFFGYNGTSLKDPQKLLQGSGAKNRFLRLESAERLRDPAVIALVAQAMARSKPVGQERGRLTIRSVSAKQRPRR